MRREEYMPLMERMAAGDRSAIFDFHEQCGPVIGGVVVRVLHSAGREVGDEDLAAIVVDICMWFGEHAGAWRPDGGASPWTWAQNKISEIAHRHLGQLCFEYDETFDDDEEEEVAAPVSLDDTPTLDILADLSAVDDVVAEFRDRLYACAKSDRDRELYLMAVMERQSGNPAPLALVADLMGIAHATCRKAYSRVASRMEAAA